MRASAGGVDPRAVPPIAPGAEGVVPGGRGPPPMPPTRAPQRRAGSSPTTGTGRSPRPGGLAGGDDGAGRHCGRRRASFVTLAVWRWERPPCFIVSVAATHRHRVGVVVGVALAPVSPCGAPASPQRGPAEWDRWRSPSPPCSCWWRRPPRQAQDFSDECRAVQDLYSWPIVGRLGERARPPRWTSGSGRPPCRRRHAQPLGREPAGRRGQWWWCSSRRSGSWSRRDRGAALPVARAARPAPEADRLAASSRHVRQLLRRLAVRGRLASLVTRRWACCRRALSPVAGLWTTSPASYPRSGVAGRLLRAAGFDPGTADRGDRPASCSPTRTWRTT
jgi:hypothetical protein